MSNRLMILLSAILLLHTGSYAQHAYYDALQLDQLLAQPITQPKMDSALNILKNYLSEGQKNAPGLNLNMVKAAYSKNPFMPATLKSPNSNAAIDAQDFSSVISSIGGLDVTSFADGFAKFIVKRTKEELNVAFFTRFKSVLEDSNYRDIKTVFPNTFDLLESAGSEIYNYDRYIQNLREAFTADLKALPKNMPGIIDNHPELFTEYPEVVAALRSACYITGGLADQVHPGDILAEYPLEYLDSLKNKNYKGALQTLQLVNISLRDTGTGENARYWVTAKQLRVLTNNMSAFKIYMGLIYQMASNNDIQFEKTTLKNVLDTVAAYYDKGYNVYQSYRNYVVTFSEKATALEQMMKTYKKSDNDSTKIELYASYFRATVELAEYSTTAGELPYLKETFITDLHKTMQPYFDICYSTADLVTNIDRKNYPAAVNEAVQIYNMVSDWPKRDINKTGYKVQYAQANALPDAAERQKAVAGVNSSVASDNILTVGDRMELSRCRMMPISQDSLTLLSNKLQRKKGLQQYLDKLNIVINKLTMYGSFISTVAMANTSDEVEEAIDAFALPSGSSRIKRETPFNVSLNAYCGLFTGYELIEGHDELSDFQLNTHGITAPIGIAISKGRSKFMGIPRHKNERHWSYSAFVSVLDLGAVTAFRFNDPTTSQIPKIELKDIISPGLFFSAGIPKCPLSVNAGAQIGPNLRSVTATKNSYEDNLYWRFSLSLVVDIPILNLYTKSAN